MSAYYVADPSGIPGAAGYGWATILWHTSRMPDEDHRYPSQRPVTVMVSADGNACSGIAAS